ncbi:MAG: hypothetical protein GJ680_07820 [Alteromonadaceae bacterium]|nr:hypothetical protein [Alteromonadaceae bacterium]
MLTHLSTKQLNLLADVLIYLSSASLSVLVFTLVLSDVIRSYWLSLGGVLSVLTLSVMIFCLYGAVSNELDARWAKMNPRNSQLMR